MKKLVEDIAKALVDIPEAVSVRVVEGKHLTVLELKVAPSDLGRVIIRGHDRSLEQRKTSGRR